MPLHSNLVLFKLVLVSVACNVKYGKLYIPIWFYSNKNVHQKRLKGSSFTFQSGSIQIRKANEESLKALNALHSNLVLFKCIIAMIVIFFGVLYIPIWFYSNEESPILTISAISLYIPIWFYSNKFSVSVFYKVEVLYIPIWFYSNICHRLIMHMVSHLYIPIWFYSNTDIEDKEYNELIFTFQSGSIQMGDKITIIINFFLYIPIWFYSNCYGFF